MNLQGRNLLKETDLLLLGSGRTAHLRRCRDVWPGAPGPTRLPGKIGTVHPGDRW